MSFFARLWFAWVAYFRVLLDGSFAARVQALASGEEPPQLPDVKSAPKDATAKPKDDPAPALALLALLQREGRLVDFLEQDVATFSDADVGAAARVVHEGCRKALRAHAKFAPVRSENEDAKVTIDAGYAPSEVKLTGDVKGAPPFSGTLRHRGWKVLELTLPSVTESHDARVIAPAEIEL